MTGDRIKKWLEQKINVNDISEKNLTKLEIQDQIVVNLIKEAMDGTTAAIKLLHDMAYGVLKPGEGPNKTETNEEVTYAVDFNIAEDEDDTEAN